jgi:hypothetical protein
MAKLTRNREHQFDGGRGEHDALERERRAEATNTQTTMTDETPMPFGKYKGQKMKHVPADYLLWLWDCGPELHKVESGVAAYIRANFAAIMKDAPDIIVTHYPSHIRK